MLPGKAQRAILGKSPSPWPAPGMMPRWHRDVGSGGVLTGWGTASPRRGAGRSLRTGFPGIPAVPSRRSHPCLRLFPPSDPWGRWARWGPPGHRVPLDLWEGAQSVLGATGRTGSSSGGAARYLHGEGGAFPAAPGGASRPSGCSSGPSSVPGSPSACSPGNPSLGGTQWQQHQ